jgi:two-component system heavy metal sensor histidine kinase CusS
LLNTTLDLAEAEAGAPHTDRGPLDFSDVVRQLVDIYQPAMAARHHEVTAKLEEHVVVDADLALLNRAVSNLLENELTHLPPGCRVNIRLLSHPGQRNGCLRIMDRDFRLTSASGFSSDS